MAKATNPKTSKKPAGDIRKSEDYEFAYLLFLQKVPLKEIATRCSVAPNTLTAWKDKGEWEKKRAAKTISMDVLLNKALQKINDLLDSEDFNADSFAKAVNQLKALKTANTVDDDIMFCMKFQEELMEQRAYDKTIDEAFLKNVVRLQDMYIKKRLGNG